MVRGTGLDGAGVSTGDRVAGPVLRRKKEGDGERRNVRKEGEGKEARGRTTASLKLPRMTSPMLLGQSADNSFRALAERDAPVESAIAASAPHTVSPFLSALEEEETHLIRSPRDEPAVDPALASETEPPFGAVGAAPADE